MSRLPRLGIGVVEPLADPTPILWGLLAALDRRGIAAQSFHSRACFEPHDGATAITGFAPRHLDSWLMSDNLCRQAFLRGMRRAEIAIVDGSFAADDSPPCDADGADQARGGKLDDLCEWLNLPRLAIVDVRRLSDCRLPPKPAGLDGVLLDGAADPRDFYRLQTQFESLWQIPVFGGVEDAPGLRRAIARLEFGEGPSPELADELATAFERLTDLERIVRLAARYEFPFRALDGPGERMEPSKLRIAMACDDAFRCYFPDALELLEMRGATICDFSPLKDERLPPESDIVYFGCGRPDKFADALAANTLMISALRGHLCNGQRIYAECGGLAYLSRQIEFPDGSHAPMVGALPVTARLGPAEPPRSHVARLGADCWLGRRGDLLRGYLNSRWTIASAERPMNGELCFAGSGPASADALARRNPPLIARHQAIGSRLHLNFAAQPAALEAFFHPHAAMMDVDSPALARVL